jgi:hypothetical protein
MTREQARLLRFALKYPGWHSFAPKYRRTLRTLEAHGLVNITGTQFCIAQDYPAPAPAYKTAPSMREAITQATHARQVQV